MERDFLGLSSREPLAVVKEEITSDARRDSGLNKGPGARWPFLNKVSAVPHLMSFKVAQDEKPNKRAADPVSSSGFKHIPIGEAQDSSKRCKVVDIQNSLNGHRQGGTQFSLTSYPQQTYPHDARPLSLSKQAISVSISDPFLKTHFTATGQPVSGALTKQRLPGSVLVSSPNSDLLHAGAIVGTTESRGNVKSSGPPQLTIFYAGTVNVYDDISPEKAQAMMLLAGNGAPIVSKPSPVKCYPQASATVNMISDHVDLNQPSTQPCSGLSSPISVSSHPVHQLGSGVATVEEKKDGNRTSPSKVDGRKMVSSMGSIATTTMIPSAIPQARKASLARFLEKRKERAMNPAPYDASKSYSECATPESKAVNRSPGPSAE